MPGDGEPLKTQVHCPHCGREMAPGWVASVGLVNWVDKIGWMDGSIFKGDPVISLIDSLGGTAHLRAWRCLECRMVLVDYGTIIP